MWRITSMLHPDNICASHWCCPWCWEAPLCASLNGTHTHTHTLVAFVSRNRRWQIDSDLLHGTCMRAIMVVGWEASYALMLSVRESSQPAQLMNQFSLTLLQPHLIDSYIPIFSCLSSPHIKCQILAYKRAAAIKELVLWLYLSICPSWADAKY